jgi:hypothetical protein
MEAPRLSGSGASCYVEKAVERLTRQLRAPRGILILIDADTDCPAELGPTLLERARGARPDIPIGLVLAKREFEAWFLASIESLRGQRGISEDAAMTAGPEDVRDAKGRLTRMMVGSGAYHETRDQPALTAIFDMNLARKRSDSFDKCWREIERLLAEASGKPVQEGP